MVVSSYADFFSLMIFAIFLIPAIIIGILGKKTIGSFDAMKCYGIIISVPMMTLLFGLSSIQMKQFLIFLLCEILLVYAYYFFNKRANSEFVYFSVLVLSMLPIFILKICAHTYRFSHLGFIGVSYISFRIWQLIIDIHDKNIDKLPFPETLYFLTFFPTISSGPIDRYQRFMKDLNTEIETKDYITNYLFLGIKKISMGVLYKFALATLINIYIIEKLPPHATSFLTTILYMYAYTLYLFFDFAGYSNFAIGTSYILRIKTPENFNKPFLSHNMKEFWERWHMSLSKWFGDYLFSRFVLNSLRNGTFKSKKVATRCGYMLTMIIMGLWHGFYLFYISYGVYQGLMLVLTDIYIKSKTYRKFRRFKYYSLISRIICFQVISLGMLLFSGYLFNF